MSGSKSTLFDWIKSSLLFSHNKEAYIWSLWFNSSKASKVMIGTFRSTAFIQKVVADIRAFIKFSVTLGRA